MSKRILAVAIATAIFLTGCKIVETNQQSSDDAQLLTNWVPIVGDPPDYRFYVDKNGRMNKGDAEKYYNALHNYVEYLRNYTKYIGEQYDVPARQREAACNEALRRTIKSIRLKDPPELEWLADDEVVDKLVDYIGELRSAIAELNSQIYEKSHDISRYCSK